MKNLTKLNLGIVAGLALCVAALPARAAYQFTDGFESYANGSSLHGQNGWAGWDNAAAATGYALTSPFAHDGNNVLQIVGTSDLTHTFAGTGNAAILSIWQFLPNAFTGDSFVILLNTYAPGGPDAWSAQVHANAATGLISDDNGLASQTLPLIKGEWVEYRFMIDFLGNSVSDYYNNQLLSTHRWYDPADANARARLQAIDLFGNGAGNVYYDSLLVVIPEPGSLSLVALGVGLVLALRRKAAR